MATTVESPAVRSGRARTGHEAHAPTGPRAQVSARAREGTATAWSAIGNAVRWVSRGKLFDARPHTIREVAAYTWAGGWIPGDRARWLENVGRAYGFALAVPVTAACYVLLWFVQRPTRVVLGALLWWAARWAL